MDKTLDRPARIAALGYDYAAQQKSPLDSCNLCGGCRWSVLTYRDRYGYPAQATACRLCGLTVLNPRMTATAYGHFYESVYRPLVSAFHGRRIDAVTIKDEQRVYAVAMGELLAPYLHGHEGRKLLDVGGSTGVVAAYLATRFDLSTTIIDPSADEIAEARTLGIETIRGLVEEWEPDQRKFDVIGMFQTVDHLLDVAMTLRKLRSLLADGGIFVVDIVDFRAAFLRNWSVEMAVKIDHPFYLTESTMEALLARAGFDPMHKSYSADHLHVAYVCRISSPIPDATPNRESTDRFFDEIRYVQNAPVQVVRH